MQSPSKQMAKILMNVTESMNTINILYRTADAAFECTINGIERTHARCFDSGFHLKCQIRFEIQYKVISTIFSFQNLREKWHQNC